MSSLKVPNHYMMRGDVRPTEEQLRASVPAIFATVPALNVSERYGFVSTRKIIDIMEDDGYQVVQARGGIRLGSREHGIHEVRLRKIDQQVKLYETFPEIVLLNSHNATSAAVLHMGLYRQVCSNGLVVGDSFETSFRVSHVGDPRENVVNAARHLMDSAPRLGETIETWRSRGLTTAEIEEFGRRAAELRKLPGAAMFNDRVGSVTGVRRHADVHNNLWNVFNRTQENLIGGGVMVANEKTGRVRRTRGLRAVKPLIELNRGLWDLAEEFLPN